MTDEFEDEVGEMLHNRVAELPASYEVEPSTLACARRRRATKLASLATGVVVVVAGSVASVARAMDRAETGRVLSAGSERSVPTVRCEARLEGGSPGRPGPPVIAPRIVEAADDAAAEHLASYAAYDDPRYVVLGPKGWACGTSLSVDGRRGQIDLSPKGPSGDHAGVSVTNDYLWHGLAGSELACSASNDPAVLDYVRKHDRALGVCEPDRTITRVDANVSTFRDPDGMLGASWIRLPSSDSADDGRVSLLTCGPTDGLTAADCNAVIADWIARMRAANTSTVATVPTVACPITYAVTPDAPLPSPSTAPRQVTVPGADKFVSYAASTDPRYVLLGPKGWDCSGEFAADGQNGYGVGPPASSGVETGGVGVVNDFLWHGGVGSGLACTVSDDPAVAAYIAANFPEEGPCPRADRTVTRVDAHTTTWVRTDGARGVGWIVLPSSPGASDGKVSVLSCQPTKGLTAADCDVIVADWIAWVAAPPSPAEPMLLAPAPYPATDWAATDHGFAITAQDGHGLAAYDATADQWRQYGPPPFSGEHYLFAARGDTVFVAGLAPDLSHTAPFASLNLTTGRWRSLAPIPSGVPSLLSTGDATHIFGVGAFESNGDSPPGTIAVEYDAAADRWTKLPSSPLGARGSFTLQWTGTELLIWSGGSNHQGCVPAFTDGAAYDPATGSWRALPAAPISARYHGASAWTGTEMLVWGGDSGNCGTKTLLATGGAYNPATNEWRTLPDAPLRPTRLPAAVWTGQSFVVLGSGADGEVAVASYTPGNDSWRTLPPPSVREGNGVYAAVLGGRPIFDVWLDGVLTAFAYPPE